MTTRDAAALLIAIMTSPIAGPSVAGAAERTSRYAALPAVNGMAGSVAGGTLTQRLIRTAARPILGERASAVTLSDTGPTYQLNDVRLPSLAALPAGHTAIDAISALLGDIAAAGVAEEILEPRERVWVKSGVAATFSAPHEHIEIAIETPTWLSVMEYRGAVQVPRDKLGSDLYAQSRVVGARSLLVVASVVATA
jgi:hypothetical protein